MNILFIRAHNPYFESSASGNRYAGILEGLINQGVNVNMIITEGYQNYNEYSSKGKNVQNEKIKVKYLLPIFNNNIWLRRLYTYVLSGFFALIINLKLQKHFKRNYDFVWVTFEHKILKSLDKYAYLLKGKTIIELNEYNDLHNFDKHSSTKLQRHKAEIENRNFLKVIKKIDIILVMTKALISHYQVLSNKEAKFLHLPMTVDFSRFCKNTDQIVPYKKPYIAYTGTFNNQKDGIEILIRSFAKVINHFPTYTLYLAGFYHYDVSSQQKLIKELNLSDKIIFIGVLDKSNIPEFIQNADLLVMARPDSRQAQGGFPTKLGEYLATGNPVCVTKVGEIPDYLEDNISAFLAEPGDVDSFANAMLRALSNKSNAKAIGQMGREVALKHFNKDIQVKNLVDFLTEQIK